METTKQNTITLIKGLYCTPACDGRIEGTIRGNSIYVRMDVKSYRLSLAKIMAGEKENRNGWIFENAANLSAVEIEKMEDQAANWYD